MYDFGDDYAETYTNECEGCGEIIQVSTQKDEYPEYHTYVFVKCRCGESVGFSLPVN